MQVVALLYPPFVLMGQPVPGAWPPSDEQREVRFMALAHIIRMTVPNPQTGQPMPVIQVSGMGDWTLRVGSWAASRDPQDDEQGAYNQWRAAQSGIQIANSGDPLLKGGPPRGPGLRRVQ